MFLQSDRGRMEEPKPHTPMPPNDGTLGHFARVIGHCFVGMCSTCRPPRIVHVDMEELIAIVGAGYSSLKAMKQITCKVCGTNLNCRVGLPLDDVEQRGS